MTYVNSPPLRQQISRILKHAEDEAASKKKCLGCGKEMENGKCPCGYMAGAKQEKESMGTAAHGGYDSSSMDVTASVDVLPGQMNKLAGALRYASNNFYNIVDDRPVGEKLAELQSFAVTAQKIAQGELSPTSSDAQGTGLLENTLNEDANQKKEQVVPHRGKKVYPAQTPVSALGELENNATDDRTGEEWGASVPTQAKRASSAFHKVLRKRQIKIANQPGAPMGGAPAPAPAAPAPAGAPPMGAPAPAAAPPQPPPGPDPRMIAQQLMQQGALTPEALAQAAGISPEEAAAVIASMTGGTGAPPPAPPVGGGAPPMGGPEAGGAPPAGGAPGMAVQASAEPGLIFQNALRKLAGEDVSKANIRAPKVNSRPEEEGIKTPNLPGSSGLASNEAAIAFKAQEGRRPRDEAVGTLLSASVPYKAESGKRTGYAMDSMLGDKTSSVKEAAARQILHKLSRRGNRPS